MINVYNLSLQFGKKILFDKVNIKFYQGDCYGIIGANGVGKSTFLKLISQELQANTGQIIIENNKRISTLKQEHNIYNEYPVIQTVILGNQQLYDIKKAMEILYSNQNFSEKDGIKAGELSLIYEELGGWNAESDAATLLSDLGVHEKFHYKMMKEIDNKYKVKILLAQALFGNPDILILDEPTNGLDIMTISWLENFLANYINTVIVVSHDRHFLDAICTHICDINFGKINRFTGNYTFWYETSKLINRQRLQQNKKIEEKRKEIQEFINRFSSNASKAKQATARKKMLEKLDFDDIKNYSSSRRSPTIIFEPTRKVGNQILSLKKISKKLNNNISLNNISFNIKNGEKIAIISDSNQSIHILYEIIMNNIIPDNGEIIWGQTITRSYLPLDISSYFNKNISIIDWLQQYTKIDEERYEEYLRSLLGKMLFSGEDVLKKINILSGGEKMRCIFSKIMLEKSNVLILNEPTNHLDIESIISLNNAIKKFHGIILITSKDHTLLQSVCNRIIEITPNGIIDKYMTYDEYLSTIKLNKI